MLEPSTSFRIVAIASSQLVGLANPSRSSVRATWTPTAPSSVFGAAGSVSEVGRRRSRYVVDRFDTVNADALRVLCGLRRRQQRMHLAPRTSRDALGTAAARQSSNIARMPAGAQFDLRLILQCVVVARSPSADRFSSRDISQAADRSTQRRAAATVHARARTLSDPRRAAHPVALPRRLHLNSTRPRRARSAVPRLSPHRTPRAHVPGIAFSTWSLRRARGSDGGLGSRSSRRLRSSTRCGRLEPALRPAKLTHISGRTPYTRGARGARSVRPDLRVWSACMLVGDASAASTRSTLMCCACCAGCDGPSLGCIWHREYRVLRLAPQLRHQSSRIARMPAGALLDLAPHLLVRRRIA